MPKIGERFNPSLRWEGLLIPDGIWKFTDLAPVEMVMYARLARFQYEDGDDSPTIGTLAKEIRISDRSAQTILSRLEEKGFIRIERRMNASNVYHFLNHRCFEGHISEDAEAHHG